MTIAMCEASSERRYWDLPSAEQAARLEELRERSQGLRARSAVAFRCEGCSGFHVRTVSRAARAR